MTGTFSQEALDAVQAMFAEGQENAYLGKCGQKKLRQQHKEQRTPEQAQADKARAQANQGQNKIPDATRSEAAKKAAQTRARCRGGQTQQPQPQPG